MRVAILGTRGIPANYGGFETFAEELGNELAERGYDVEVVGRRRWVGEGRRLGPGLRTRNVASAPGKYFETVSATLLSALLSRLPRRVVLCNTAAALAIPILRARGIAVAVNVDGFEWQRKKWGWAGRNWYKFGERLTRLTASVIVADADVVADYYLARTRRPVVMIPYGSSVQRQPDLSILEDLRLEHERYVLYVSRFEPENNPELVIDAFSASSCDMPLVMLGDAVYDAALGERVRAAAGRDPRIRLLGARYGAVYRALQSSAYAYIQATEVGGTHPALVEAMGAGNLVLCLDTPENAEVVGGAGAMFQDQFQLTALLNDLDPTVREAMGRRAAARVQECYSWRAIADAYERLLGDL